ncbi:alpha/beta hydrolase [Sphingomonas sp. RB1R13]|uniref:alpha/beta hydrolase n=1 Tax=Sphingomonas sp. RB1R13 TaxID=3096159 RepID=UPI002FCB1830
MSFLLAALLATTAPTPTATSAAPISRPLTAGPTAALAGTLAMPVGRARATLLIIPGSGPTDRDGNNVMGVAAAPYRMLASDLAARGIATVRIDKRGMFASKAAGNPNAASIALYARDTADWVAATRRATGARCVWLAGHSEGGLIALVSAHQPGICGLILIAAPGRPLGQIIRAQLLANPANAPLLPPALAALDQLEAGKHADLAKMHPALAKGLFNPKVQDYLIEAFRYDPAALAKGTTVPLLIVQGEHDIQVSRADADRLASAQPRAKLAVIAGMNHVLKIAPADRAANVATYADPALPLAPGLVDAIVGFVTGAKK